MRRSFPRIMETGAGSQVPFRCVSDAAWRRAALKSRREADGATIPSATSFSEAIKSAHRLQGKAAESGMEAERWEQHSYIRNVGGIFLRQASEPGAPSTT